MGTDAAERLEDRMENLELRLNDIQDIVLAIDEKLERAEKKQ